MITRSFRDRWAAKLRSGKYKQCRRHLYDGEGYCCLGVGLMSLDDLNLLEFNIADLDFVSMPKDLGFISASKFEDDLEDYSFELEESSPHQSLFGADAFSHMNDALGWSFDEIANVVESLRTSDDKEKSC